MSTKYYLEDLFSARLGAVEGNDGLKLALQDCLGRLVCQIRAKNEDLRLLLHVLRLHRAVTRLRLLLDRHLLLL